VRTDRIDPDALDEASVGAGRRNRWLVSLTFSELGVIVRSDDEILVDPHSTRLLTTQYPLARVPLLDTERGGSTPRLPLEGR